MTLVNAKTLFNLVLKQIVCLSSERSGDEIDLITNPRNIKEVISISGDVETHSSQLVADPLTVYRSGQNEIRAGRAITLDKKISFIGSTGISLYERRTMREAFGFLPFTLGSLNGPPRSLGSTQILGKDFVNKGLSSLEFNSGGSHYQLSFEVLQGCPRCV